MSNQTQANTLQDILKWEQENKYSREAVTVKSGQNLSLGAVIGKITKSVPAAGTPGESNSGGGTVASVVGGTKTKIGTYSLACVSYEASPLAAVFEVVDPEGNSLPDAGIGAYANEQINFTIADGSPVIAVGDTFAIEVVEGSGEVVEIDFDAVDGSQDASGFVIADYDASLGAVPAVAVVRDAVIVAADLVWPATSPAVTAEQKAAALAQLAARGVVERGEA